MWQIPMLGDVDGLKQHERTLDRQELLMCMHTHIHDIALDMVEVAAASSKRQVTG